MLKQLFPAGLLALSFVVPAHAQEQTGEVPSPPPQPALPRVLISTSMGDIVVELEKDKAPLTVKNFLSYVKKGYYNGMLFHRVIPGFMIQGGGYTPDFKRRPLQPEIKSEADNGLKNLRGTLAMARGTQPHTAFSEFFINVADTPSLDYTEPTDTGWGYAVFGRVVQGMEVVEAIEAVPTAKGGPFEEDVPVTPVLIKKITLLPPVPPAPAEKPAS